MPFAGTADAADMQMQEALQKDPSNIYFGDDRLSVRFELFPLENPDLSKKEGRPIYEDKEFIRIRVPGDSSNVIHREATDMDKRRFARQYDNFKRGQADAIVGTPLTAWPAISRARVEELRHFGVVTVEGLAGIPDSTAGKFMGIQSLKKQAQDFLAAAAGNAPVSKLRAEIEEKDKEMAAMQQTIEEMKKAINDLQKRK